MTLEKADPNPEQIQKTGKEFLLAEMSIPSFDRIMKENDDNKGGIIWPATIMTRLNVIMGTLNIMNIDKQIPQADYEVVGRKLDTLLEETVRPLFGIYTQKHQVIPAGEQATIFEIAKQLDMLLKEILLRSQGRFIDESTPTVGGEDVRED